MRFIFCLPVCCLMVFAGCNNMGGSPGNGNSDTVRILPKAPKPEASSGLAHEGTTLIMTMINRYYDLKNALVATKADKADSAARQLVVMAGILQRYLQADTAHGAALSPYLDTIVSEGRAVSAMKDESCEKQRIFFGHISSALYGLVKNAGLKNAGIFHEYCPMAFNEKGATWLSDETDIKNPYFGKKMLECGEVTDSL